jgi:hypothetical protein
MNYDTNLPEGMTCANCVSFKLCALNLGMQENSTRCNFFPISFVNRCLLYNNESENETGSQTLGNLNKI